MSISTCGRMKLELYFLFVTIINTKYLKVFIKSPHSKTEKNASIFITIKAVWKVLECSNTAIHRVCYMKLSNLYTAKELTEEAAYRMEENHAICTSER